MRRRVENNNEDVYIPSQTNVNDFHIDLSFDEINRFNQGDIHMSDDQLLNNLTIFKEYRLKN